MFWFSPALATGGVVLLFTVCVNTLVQPFKGSVTVNVYVPTAETVGLVDVDVNPPGPLQL